MSYKPEVQTAGDGDKWTGNACRFATEQEAKDYVFDLWQRWTAVKEVRVVESEDPVNYKWDNGLVSIATPSPAGP